MDSIFSSCQEAATCCQLYYWVNKASIHNPMKINARDRRVVLDDRDDLLINFLLFRSNASITTEINGPWPVL
jgi:hypothetical protein